MAQDRGRLDQDDPDEYGYEDAGEYPDQQPGGTGDAAGAQGSGAPGGYGYRDPGAYPEEQPGGSGDGRR
jgi:hypothetical protein